MSGDPWNGGWAEVHHLALDRSIAPEARMRLLRRLLQWDTGTGKEMVRRIASDPLESEEMLTLAGRQFAMLMLAGAVSQFDMRDLTELAFDIVDTSTPADLWS